MLDEAARKRTFDHAMELWFLPEIKRRQEIGVISKPYHLYAAQVIIRLKIQPHEIRLNEEVQAEGDIQLKEGIVKNEGEPVYSHELAAPPSIRLSSSADPNCGHFTLFLIGDRWYGGFDFRYNKGKARDFLVAAQEFYESASDALAADRLRVAIDNLFSASELAAKAFVVATLFSDTSSHGQVHKQFNMLSRTGDVDTDHRKTFNALSDARANARYVHGPLKHSRETISKWQQDVKNLISSVLAKKT